MSNAPQVSVVIPTYNRSNFLRSAVASALAQTLQDFEIIVVDDASEDDTEKTIRDLGDDRIRFIRHDTNQGVAAARNTSVVNSKGKYIAFLDDDDEWFPEKLERQFSLLERSSKIIGGVYSGWLGVDAASGRILYQRTPTRKGDIFAFMLAQDSLAPTSCFFLRKECFDKIGLFDVNFKYGEDFDMWLRIARAFHFDYVEEPLVKYSVPDDSKLSLSSNLEARIKASEGQLKKYAGIIASDRRYHSRRYLGLGVLYCYNGNLRKGRQSFIRAIKIHPFEPRNYFNLCLSLWGAKNFKKWKMLKEKAWA
jgi:glycosyltransferase involved in cell wall biosynthesis